jgi:peptidoglycan/LPS O-acetylase OafA/YrhL
VLNWAHIHLVLTHIPVIGIGVVLAFLLAGLARRSRELKWVSLQMFVALALLCIAVYLTGSPASHQMREMPGISRETIHYHSSVADFAFGFMEVLGALSLGALVKFRNLGAIPARFMTALVALAFLVLILMIWTANLGGRIRHSEIGASNSARQILTT